MDYKPEKFHKKFIALLLVLSFVLPASFAPIFANKASAGIPTFDIPDNVKKIIDGIGMILAKRLVDHMVRSTVKWAQSGFEGNPAYVTDPQQFFTDIADQTAGEFIATTGSTTVAALCSPFRAQIQLSLAQQYYPEDDYACTLTDIVDNIEGFYGDFSQGGWEAWLSMTQRPTNNAYGSFIQARADLDSRIANAVGLKDRELSWSSGFLSKKKCLGTEYLDKATGQKKCVGKEVTETPGDVIKEQLNKVLPSGLEQLISAQHIEQLVTAFASGLLNRYVFNDKKGLFSKGSSGAGSQDFIDFDNDGIPDGWDYDLDGEVDYCNHGFRTDAPANSKPSNDTCFGSTQVSSSPFFAPLCEDLAAATRETEKLLSFVNAVKFDGPPSAPLWMNKLSPYSGALSSLQQTMLRMDVREWDKATRMLSGEIKFADDHLNKLAEKGVLAYGAGGDSSAEGFRQWLPGNIQYLKDFRVALNRCEDPDTGASGRVVPPENPYPEGGGQCEVSGEQYAGALREAMNAVISERPDVAALDPRVNTAGAGEREYRGNAILFLGLVSQKLRSMGYSATEEVLNGNNLPNTGDLIAVWRSGDTDMERYDAISGSATTIGTAAMTEFTGFIPLNCTLSGGGNDCGCKDGGEGGGGGETGGGGGEPGDGIPSISSVSPASLRRGDTLTISGEDLTTTVQFFDGSGGRNTVVGSINSAKTQVTVKIPADQPVGNATVKIYKDAATVSNGKLIQITGSGGGTITTVSPTSVWTPPQTINNWYPKISPDAKYYTYGNWGENWVTDIATKQIWEIPVPSDIASNNTRCMAGNWISTSTISFNCELTNTTMARYEMSAPEWEPTRKNDDVNLVAGNWFTAGEGYWTSFLVAGFRLAQNNKVVATGVGGALSAYKDKIVHACTNSNTTLCVRRGDGTLLKTYYPVVPLNSTAVYGDYIMYGTYGQGVRGITPGGLDIDLTVAPWKGEGLNEKGIIPIQVNGKTEIWVTTFAWDDNTSKGYVFLRPWASKSVIAVEAAAVNLSVVAKDGVFYIAYNNEKGRGSIITVPVNSPRTTIN